MIDGNAKHPARRAWHAACILAVVVGLIMSGLLLAVVFELGSDPYGTFDICAAVFGSSCDAALTRSTSWQLGIPLAGWGVIYYATLGTLSPLGDSADFSFGVWMKVADSGVWTDGTARTSMMIRNTSDNWAQIKRHTVNNVMRIECRRSGSPQS